MALSDPPASRKDTVAEKATYFFFGKNDEDEHVVVQGKHSSDQIEQLVRRSQTLTEKGLWISVFVKGEELSKNYESDTNLICTGFDLNTLRKGEIRHRRT